MLLNSVFLLRNAQDDDDSNSAHSVSMKFSKIGVAHCTGFIQCFESCGSRRHPRHLRDIWKKRSVVNLGQAKIIFGKCTAIKQKNDLHSF